MADEPIAVGEFGTIGPDGSFTVMSPEELFGPMMALVKRAEHIQAAVAAELRLTTEQVGRVGLVKYMPDGTLCWQMEPEGTMSTLMPPDASDGDLGLALEQLLRQSGRIT